MKILLILLASAVFGFVMRLAFCKPTSPKKVAKTKTKQKRYRARLNDDESDLYGIYMM